MLAVFVPAMLTLACAPQQTATTNPAPPPVDPVKRGEYLTTIMNCNDCHTPGYFYGAPDYSRKLSGSEVGWTGPWGTAYARNLTPDSTGIGAWTEDQIIHTIRTGNTPDGRQLAPIMPYVNFAALNDEDAHAIVAYLKSLTPVHHVNKPLAPPGSKDLGPSHFIVPPPPAWDVPKGPPKS
jgi:mono/diheme cytochrome c family protein